MDNICNYCLQPGNLVPTGEGENAPLVCTKCQPYVQDTSSPGDNAGEYSSIIEPQVVMRDDVTTEDYESLHCSMCNKTFEKSFQYQNHMRNHRAERKFVCPHCTKAFSQSNNLRAHLRIHTNERPYKCKECGKAFTQVTNLNNHIRLHTGERPFACTVPGCDKAFAQVTNLNNHRKSHQKDMMRYQSAPHPSATQGGRRGGGTGAQVGGADKGRLGAVTCQACGDSFQDQKTLKKHLLRDCSQRNYTMSYAQQTQMIQAYKAIKKSVPGVLTIKCLFGDCQRHFDTQENLHTHLSSDHGISINSYRQKHAKPELTNEVIEIDDDDSSPSPKRSSYSSTSHINQSTASRTNIESQKVKQEKSDSSSSDSDDDDDSDEDSSSSSDDNVPSSKQENGLSSKGGSSAAKELMLVCNKCFSTFNNHAALETHMRSKHKN